MLFYKRTSYENSLTLNNRTPNTQKPAVGWFFIVWEILSRRILPLELVAFDLITPSSGHGPEF